MSSIFKARPGRTESLNGGAKAGFGLGFLTGVGCDQRGPLQIFQFLEPWDPEPVLQLAQPIDVVETVNAGVVLIPPNQTQRIVADGLDRAQLAIFATLKSDDARMSLAPGAGTESTKYFVG